jgi:hypothetical protein
MAADTPHWAPGIVADVLAWHPTRVENLSGTGVGSAVARVGDGARSVVVKRYPESQFAAARLVASLSGAPFAPVLGECAEHRALVFADLGRTTFQTLLAAADGPADRRRHALAYLRAVEQAADALSALGTPAPSPRRITSLDAFVGFTPLSSAARTARTPAQQLLAVAAYTGRLPDHGAVEAARRADHDVAEAFAAHAHERRWILADSNPSNLLAADDGPRWVDVSPAAGLIDTNLLSLPGASFRLDEPTLFEVLARRRHIGLDASATRTLNGLYSVFTLADTCAGLATGERDGTAHAGGSYRDTEQFSLGLAEDYLARGLPAARGYLPLVRWLTANPGKDPATTGHGGER